MVVLGERQGMTCYKKVDFGVYLGSNDNERVLLPKKEVPEDFEEGDSIDVFIYKDSEDRLIATTRTPYITLNNLAVLNVKSVGKIGAFLDWGLEKDLFMPFKEMTERAEEGKSYLVYLYVDKSDRLAATMKVYKYLKTTDKYAKDDVVTGTVFEINNNIGAFVAVDNKYYGLIPKKEMHKKLKLGSQVQARVTSVRDDGKLNLSINKKIPEQMEEDAIKILEVIKEYDGELPYNDKASPEIIARDFGISKAAFKRGVGRLLKAGKIDIDEKSIKIKE